MYFLYIFVYIHYVYIHIKLILFQKDIVVFFIHITKIYLKIQIITITIFIKIGLVLFNLSKLLIFYLIENGDNRLKLLDKVLIQIDD